MPGRLSGTQPWFEEILSDCCREAGEDRDVYVARAVANRMTNDIRHGGSNTDELRARLAANGLLGHTITKIDAALNDSRRLDALRAVGLREATSPSALDRIAEMAAGALDVSAAAIWLVNADTQTAIGAAGLAQSGVQQDEPIDRSISKYIVVSGRPLVVPDARTDGVLASHPLVRDGLVGAYLGMPVMDSSGHVVATICVWDATPRSWLSGHIATLDTLALLTTEHLM